MSENGQKRPRRLLVAEDHFMNQRLIEKMLEALGYQVTVVDNGHDAVEAVRSKPFDGVLLDIEMPVMDGFEAAAKIRCLEGTVGRLPLIALSAHSGEEMKHQARDRGFDGFFVKPINVKELAVALSRFVPRE